MDGFAGALDRFYHALDGIEVPAFAPSKHMVLGDHVPLNNPSFYKYVSEETYRYIKNGSFQFGTTSYYRDTTNTDFGDRREGISTLAFVDEDRRLTVSLSAGRNCLLFCGTGSLKNQELMKSRFGGVILEFPSIIDFCQLAARLIGAKAFYIYDVLYTDSKIYKCYDVDLKRLREVVGGGDLSDEKLHRINRLFWKNFYKWSFMPSLFAKPHRYDVETERRVVFEMAADVPDLTRIVAEPRLLDIIRAV